ncbi:hypothetical protein LJY18_18550 [Pseudomonas sp. MMS21-TM103]|uniref:hypothetical protein n=1 Tax=Pseudomonas sp. MMS21 TM103 TaxID=2886506 RepID=UPI001EDD013B|nr:hypothetical protein [Pseudomonas sp. MMS21 TM103]MCG4455273.1 hypothetical protein [Pseudomonas sp. MMS21 TM103]
MNFGKACLRGRSGLFRIALQQQLIRAIEEEQGPNTSQLIPGDLDVAENMVTAPFIESLTLRMDSASMYGTSWSESPHPSNVAGATKLVAIAVLFET